MYSVSAAGMLVLAAVGYSLGVDNVSAPVLAILLLAAFIAPRLNITVPHGNFTLSFSDTVIFLAFITFGGKIAALTASVEVVASSFYLRSRGVQVRRTMIPFNVGIAVIATSCSALLALAINQNILIGQTEITPQRVFAALAVLAVPQFLITSLFASLYYRLEGSRTFLQSFKDNAASLSITHVGGATFAGVLYLIWSVGDLITASICLFVVAFLYISYRQIITQMSKSIDRARQTQEELANTERRRREEIEEYASQLAVSLKEKEATVAELTESRRAFRHAAMHDALTSLPNRVYFCEFLDQLIAETRSQDGDRQGTHYVLFMDLSRFKSVNDTLGHNFGDRVLEAAAQRLRLSVAESDVVARFGGDEFAVVIKNVRSVADAERVAWRIHDRIAEPVSIDGSRITVGTKIGVAPLTADYSSPEEVLRDADIAMHHAEERGTNVEFFNQEIRDASLFRSQIESELPFAIERDELHLHYQPMISLSDGSLMGLEALARWNHPTKGPISPAEFVPVAEDSGLIVQMTSWLLREACRDLAAWQKSAPENAALVVSVNISGRHLSHQSLVNDIRKSLREHRLDPRTLKLEITESVAMENSGRSIEALTELARLGVQLSIDDFGTGYSNLGYLHKLPFDTIKIDRSFVASIGERGGEPGMLQTIMSLAKNLKMKVIAEGIETSEQLEMLQSLGCDYGQGYLISRPVAPTAIDDLMRAKKFWLPEAGFGAVASHGDAEKLQRIN